MDDYIPLFERDGPGTGYQIVICRPPEEKGVYEIWPLLAEKAYAKLAKYFIKNTNFPWNISLSVLFIQHRLNGTVNQIVSGAPTNALEDLNWWNWWNYYN